MGKTAAERQKEYRQRKKSDPDYLEKERSRHKKYRAAGKVSTKPAKEKTKERVRKFRERKKLGNSPYSSNSSAQKAFSRVRNKLTTVLPRSPRRRQFIQDKLALVLNSESIQMTDVSSVPQRNKGLTEEIRKAVIAYYIRDDVSRMAPGRKDFVVLRDKVMKSHIQKRHLYTTLKETYGGFLEEHPTMKIGFSSFAALRPKHVLLQCNTPQNVCICQIHSNFINIIYALSQVTKLQAYGENFLKPFLCSITTIDCYFSNCVTCPNFDTHVKDGHNLEDFVTVYLWSKQKKSSGFFHVEKCPETMTISALIGKFEEARSVFMKHQYIKKNQSEAYQLAKEHIDDGLVVCQIDYSENYTCAAQDEVQSAHWSQSQITLFTACLWTTDSESPKSIVVVSDNRHHGKETAIAYLYIVLRQIIKPDNTEFRKVHIFSDGPSSQFKNKFMANMLNHLREKLEIQSIQWSFFAASHGKELI